MKKIPKRAIWLLLAIALCFSLIPMSAMATGEAVSGDTQQGEPAPSVEPAPEPAPEPTPEPTSDPALESTAEPTMEPTPEQSAETPIPTEVQPELLKVVESPLVNVVYHYYDDAQSQSVTDFSEYAVVSSHAYPTIARASDTGITIMVNHFPDHVPVSTDALWFRVLLNGNEDITALAAYDAVTGLVSLPDEYMGHTVTVMKLPSMRTSPTRGRR